MVALGAPGAPGAPVPDSVLANHAAFMRYLTVANISATELPVSWNEPPRGAHFFLDLRGLPVTLPAGASHLYVPFAGQTSWKTAVMWQVAQVCSTRDYHLILYVLTTVPAAFDGRQLSDWDAVQQLHGGTVRLRFGGLRGGAPKAGVLKRPASIMLRSSSASAGSGHWSVSDSPDLVPVSDGAVPAPVADSADTVSAGEAGKLSAEEKKELRAKRKREYRNTPEGKAKAKAWRENYNQKAKAKVAASKYRQSAKGKAVAKMKTKKYARGSRDSEVSAVDGTWKVRAWQARLRMRWDGIKFTTCPV